MLASIVLEVDLVLVCIEVSAYLCSALLWELPSRRKKSPYSELFWSAFFQNFPAFALNTARYSVSQRIQNKRGKIAGKMRTTITPNTDTFYAVLPFRFEVSFISFIKNFFKSLSVAPLVYKKTSKLNNRCN